MSRRNWKRVQPRDLRDALDLCTEYAREKHNRSVDNIADLMGVNKWTLYKWIADTDMPIRLIKTFEHMCGIDFASRWMVVSGGNKLVIDIPKGRKGTPEDIQTLQAVAHETIGALINFYKDKANAEDTLAALQTTMEHMAWHKGNVEKYRQPELPFDED